MSLRLKGAAGVALFVLSAALTGAYGATVWSGKSLKELIESEPNVVKAVTACRNANTANQFMAHLKNERANEGKFIQSLVENTQSVEKAKASKNFKAIENAIHDESAKVTVWIDCSTTTLQVKAKNSDGTTIRLDNFG